MRIMHVTYFETGPVPGQTARSQCRHTAFMGYLSQRIRLVHKLRQSICSEERINDRRKNLRINQVYRSKHFIIPHIHTFPYRTGHSGQSDAELIVQLFPYSTYAPITQVVDIIHICPCIQQFDQVFDNFDNILFRQYPDGWVGSKP